MLEFLKPVEHFGLKFDRAMSLFEFSALREPEASQFPQIGAWLMSKGIAFVPIPTPQMLWNGRLYPDLYISNRLEAVPESWQWTPPSYADYPLQPKGEWEDSLHLARTSTFLHGAKFHDTFIEPMCRKITGRSSAEISAKYHRSIWLPLYWPQTLRARASIRTPFYYPAGGYAGIVSEYFNGHKRGAGDSSEGASRRSNHDQEAAEIRTAYVVAAPAQRFSVAFIVDDSPIYRVTDMDVCAGIDAPEHRLIVEYRGECAPLAELVRLGIVGPNGNKVAFGKMPFTLPTIKNVLRGWKPRPHINDRLMEIMRAETIA